jgi:hypothetical protein
MLCPQCSSADNVVVETRSSPGYRRRRRQCGKCRERWTTYEVSLEVFNSCKNVAVAISKLLQDVSPDLIELDKLKQMKEDGHNND